MQKKPQNRKRIEGNQLGIFPFLGDNRDKDIGCTDPNNVLTFVGKIQNCISVTY